MKLDIQEIPFSRRGSFFAISYLNHSNSVWIREVRGGDESPSTLFELVIDGMKDVKSESFLSKYDFEVSETSLKVTEKGTTNQLEMIFPRADQLRIKNQGLNVELKADKVRYDTFNQMGRQQFEYISYKKETKYQLDFSTADFIVDAPWYRVGNTRIVLTMGQQQELLFTNYQVTSPKTSAFSVSFDEERAAVGKEFSDWRQSFGHSTAFQTGFDLATYIIWSSIVREEGLLTGESIFMSKNWMQNIWSWDNCFNALCVSKVDPALAYNQYLVFIEHQHASGVYADFINDKFKSYNCVKPPIHAWAYQLLIQQSAYFSEPTRLLKIYESLTKTTNFWLESRRVDETSLPYYTHGNDSGWDNASIFHKGLPVIAPDLAAYLIQQLTILGDWAKKLNLYEAAEKWEKQADRLTTQLIAELYDEKKGQFVARSQLTGEVIPKFDSLILQLPIVIADRLPLSIKKQIIENLKSRFESPFGLRTESANSPLYQVDGYWLGPIWAPETYIFFDALLRADEGVFAQRIAEKYCHLGEQGGMAENYNPETGAGNDDLSFTWTSSVFLLLRDFVIGRDTNE